MAQTIRVFEGEIPHYEGALHVDYGSVTGVDEGLEAQAVLQRADFLHSVCFVEGANPPELLLADEQKSGVSSLVGLEAIVGFLKEQGRT